MDSYSLSHSRYKCQYHVVFIPKYRKRIMYGKLKADVREIIKRLCDYRNIEIIEGAVCIVAQLSRQKSKIFIMN